MSNFTFEKRLINWLEDRGQFQFQELTPALFWACASYAQMLHAVHDWPKTTRAQHNKAARLSDSLQPINVDHCVDFTFDEDQHCKSLVLEVLFMLLSEDRSRARYAQALA